MKLEGVKWGTLGLAPLVNTTDEGGVAGKLFKFMYEKLNSFYGFKGLYHYKKKYSPSVWENRYRVYYPKLFTPKIAYSIIKAQNSKGVSDFILVQLKSILMDGEHIGWKGWVYVNEAIDKYYKKNKKY